MAEEVRISDHIAFFAGGWAVVCAVLGVLGNGAVLRRLFSRQRRPRRCRRLRRRLRDGPGTATPLFISLALADLLFSLFCLPFMAIR